MPAGNTGDPLCDAIERAVLATAADNPYPERRLEALLVRAVQCHLDADPEVRSTRREAQAREEAWTRRPGGVDLVIDVGGRRAGLEFKLDHVDQCLWDALKLCGESFDLRGLVVEAPDRVWKERLRPGVAMFTPDEAPVTWRTTELITRWPTAWRNLMIGGRGIRPTQCVSALDVVRVLDTPLISHRHHRIHVCWIAPHTGLESVTFDAIGWPSGCGTAPSDFEGAILAAEENERVEGGTPLSWPPDDGSTLTFADLPGRLPHGRAHEAMRQAWPRILDQDRPRVRETLVSRGWTPEEFEFCGIDPAA